jgi:hypothetical protein
VSDADRRALERAAREGDLFAAERVTRAQVRSGEVAVKRWYLRCATCLVVVAVETEKKPGKVACGVCDGEMDVMGRVEDSRLVTKEGERVPCDDRCVFAQGPKCDCACGSENHGSGMLVAFVVTEGVPKVTPQRDGEKARARAEEFKAALAKVRAERERVQRLVLNDPTPWAASWTPMDKWTPAERTKWDRQCLVNRMHKAISAAEKARSHNARMNRLRPHLPTEPAGQVQMFGGEA